MQAQGVAKRSHRRTGNGRRHFIAHAAGTCSGKGGSGSAGSAGGLGEPKEAEHGQDAPSQADEAAVEAACERMILEGVRLLQEGKLDQAEYLLLEGGQHTTMVDWDAQAGSLAQSFWQLGYALWKQLLLNAQA